MFVYFQSCIEFIIAQQATYLANPHTSPSSQHHILLFSHFPSFFTFFPYFNITQMDMSYEITYKNTKTATEAVENERNIMIRWMIVLCTSSHELNSYKWHASILIPSPHTHNAFDSHFFPSFTILLSLYNVYLNNMWYEEKWMEMEMCVYQCSYYIFRDIYIFCVCTEKAFINFDV